MFHLVCVAAIAATRSPVSSYTVIFFFLGKMKNENKIFLKKICIKRRYLFDLVDGSGASALLAELRARAQRQLQTTPLAADRVRAEEEAGVDGAGQVLERGLVLGVHVLEGDDGGVLAADGLTQARLVLHDRVRDLVRAAQVGDPEHQLDGVHVVRDDDHAGGLLLDRAGHLLQAGHDGQRRLRGHGLLGVRLLRLRDLVQALTAGLAGLRRVLLHQLQQLVAARAVQHLRELVQRRRHLQAALQHALLALHRHERGPAHEAGQVARVGRVLADAEVLGAGDERGRRGGLLVGLRGLRLGRSLLDFLAGHSDMSVLLMTQMRAKKKKTIRKR
ncbi:hypothetical protein STCU_00632 [Strigomonas culicis]|uniref:Uncharacterized protein n=1 Tax=Strigomonas culicis TaxID=28005 RepID=S9WK62_9TRYP|nr:hypothetical protein STCU_00632 [Strigomonas culicis]|eukprot:EPY36345.1 hypothetical protein STCU_00632 [Strigomonas culicis]